jgi:hypothetical protein
VTAGASEFGGFLCCRYRGLSARTLHRFRCASHSELSRRGRAHAASQTEAERTDKHVPSASGVDYFDGWRRDAQHSVVIDKGHPSSALRHQ